MGSSFMFIYANASLAVNDMDAFCQSNSMRPLHEETVRSPAKIGSPSVPKASHPGMTCAIALASI